MLERTLRFMAERPDLATHSSCPCPEDQTKPKSIDALFRLTCRQLFDLWLFFDDSVFYSSDRNGLLHRALFCALRWVQQAVTQGFLPYLPVVISECRRMMAIHHHEQQHGDQRRPLPWPSLFVNVLSKLHLLDLAFARRFLQTSIGSLSTLSPIFL